MEEKNKYENISVSAKTRKGMSLTCDDLQYFQRMLTVQDDSWKESFDANIKQLTVALAEVIQAQNDRMFEALEAQNKMIRKIQEDIRDIKESIQHLNLDVKDIRLELKAVKVGIKSITLEIENLNNRVKEHDFRLMHLEKCVEKHIKDHEGNN